MNLQILRRMGWPFGTTQTAATRVAATAMVAATAAATAMIAAAATVAATTTVAAAATVTATASVAVTTATLTRAEASTAATEGSSPTNAIRYAQADRAAVPGSETRRPDGQVTPGSWIGWAFLDDGGGDLPLRVRIEDDGSASFDGVAWKSFGWPATYSPQSGDQGFVLETESPKGTKLTLTGPVNDAVWRGEITLADYTGAFELMHSPQVLADVDPESYSDIEGFYRMADGDVLEIKARAWGEMVIRSVLTGDPRTLLPTESDRFFTGPAIYLPSPVETRYKFHRGTSGQVDGITQIAADGSSLDGMPFTLRTEDVQFEGKGLTLHGRVTRIDDERRRPGIVMLGGSGWRERGDHEFKERNLAALGFVTLSYDKRGFGLSEGEDPVPFETTSLDAVGGRKFLTDREDVSEVGFFGVSRGGWTAPLAVALDKEASFLVLFVPPADSPSVQEHGSRLLRMREDGASEEEVELADRMLSACWEFLADDTKWDEYQKLAIQAGERGLPEYVLESEERNPDDWQWSRMNMLYDPSAAFERIHVPGIAVFGETDRSVLTSVHRPAWERAMQRAGNEDFRFVTIAGAGHDLSRRSDAPIHRSTGGGGEGFQEVAAWARGRGLID